MDHLGHSQVPSQADIALASGTGPKGVGVVHVHRGSDSHLSLHTKFELSWIILAVPIADIAFASGPEPKGVDGVHVHSSPDGHLTQYQPSGTFQRSFSRTCIMFHTVTVAFIRVKDIYIYIIFNSFKGESVCTKSVRLSQYYIYIYGMGPLVKVAFQREVPTHQKPSNC